MLRVRVLAFAGVFALSGLLSTGFTASHASTSAVAARESAVLSPTGAPYFGPILDWSADSADAYQRRLGLSPAYFAQSVKYPLTAAQTGNLVGFVQQVASVGAAALLTLEPTTPLARLTAADAGKLVGQLRQLHARFGTDFLVRFAPEMNSNWHAWGQQPRSYVAAFDVVATAVHSGLTRTTAQMVWAPSYGAGYPFAGSVGKVPASGPRPLSQLDTNHNGIVDARDDPYSPYYPGDAAVDWVGLSMYYYGPAQKYGADVVPVPGTYSAMLAGRLGYQTSSGAGRDFVDTYARGKNKRMLVETAALYQDGQAGAPTALAVKRAWFRQVLDLGIQARHPQIKLVVWLERDRPEAEVRQRDIDWRASVTPALAQAFAASLRADRIALGPLLDMRPTPSAPTTHSATGTTQTSSAPGTEQTGAAPGPKQTTSDASLKRPDSSAAGLGWRVRAVSGVGVGVLFCVCMYLLFRTPRRSRS